MHINYTFTSVAASEFISLTECNDLSSTFNALLKVR